MIENNQLIIVRKFNILSIDDIIFETVSKLFEIYNMIIYYCYTFFNLCKYMHIRAHICTYVCDIGPSYRLLSIFLSIFSLYCIYSFFLSF